MSATTARAVNLRIRDDIRNLIDRAAHMQGRSRTDFMIDASRRAAEEALLDQTAFHLDPLAFEAFVAMLDAPPAPNDALKRTMQTPPPWAEA
jgi:uncharacterized protein (DUF1778 family)